MNVLKHMKDELKVLRKELKNSQKSKDDFDKEYEAIDKKYESRKNIDWFGGLKGKITTLNGLLNCGDKYIVIDRDGNLNFTKIRSRNQKDWYFFKGWMIGTLETIPKSNIICPESWVNRMIITKSGAVSVYFSTPDHDNFKVELIDGKFKVEKHRRNDGVLTK